MNEVKLDFKDVLIRPSKSLLASRKEVDLNTEYRFVNSGRAWCGIPIVAANMDGVGTIDLGLNLMDKSMLTCLTKHHDYEDWNSMLLNKGSGEVFKNKVSEYISISIGTSKESWQHAKKIIKDFDLKWICIDIANGYSEHFLNFVKMVREEFHNCNIIAGNVVTADMTKELILAGADIVKVGIGPGSVCTTRIKTGVGYPQLSAIMECADAAHRLRGHIMADGGCTCPGDVAKAFGAGADFVMMGGMLAGHREGGGKVITRYFKTDEVKLINEDINDTYLVPTYSLKSFEPVYEEKKFVKFYGMSSDVAMNKHSGGVANYRASEGRAVEIPYKESLDETIKDILGGLRSTCTYVGASKLKYLSECTTFVRCTQQFNSVFL